MLATDVYRVHVWPRLCAHKVVHRTYYGRFLHVNEPVYSRLQRKIPPCLHAICSAPHCIFGFFVLHLLFTTLFQRPAIMSIEFRHICKCDIAKKTACGIPGVKTNHTNRSITLALQTLYPPIISDRPWSVLFVVCVEGSVWNGMKVVG